MGQHQAIHDLEVRKALDDMTGLAQQHQHPKQLSASTGDWCRP